MQSQTPPITIGDPGRSSRRRTRRTAGPVDWTRQTTGCATWSGYWTTTCCSTSKPRAQAPRPEPKVPASTDASHSYFPPSQLVAYTLRRSEWQPPPCILACEPATESNHARTRLRPQDRPHRQRTPPGNGRAKAGGERPSLRADHLFQDGHEKLFTILVCQGHRRSVAVARRDADGSVTYCMRVGCDCADIDAGRNAWPGRPCTGLSPSPGLPDPGPLDAQTHVR